MNRPYTLIQLKERLVPIFQRNRVKKAVLFGSYSRNLASASSDVDIYVDSGLRGMRFFGLLEEVASALDCPVDLIDASDVIPDSPIAHEIDRTGVTLYER